MVAHAGWTVTDLSPAGSTYSNAAGVSNGQQVGDVEIGGGLGASLWSGTSASWMDLGALSPTYGDTSAQSVWSQGNTTYVGGYGYDADRNAHALLWTQTNSTPAPAALVMFAVGALARRRRNR